MRQHQAIYASVLPLRVSVQKRHTHCANQCASIWRSSAKVGGEVILVKLAEESYGVRNITVQPF